MIVRARRYLLAPTAEQAAAFEQYAGVCRLIHNLALEQRQVWGRRHRLNFASQCRELTALRAEFDWVQAVPRMCQEQTLRDLDRAFLKFFRGEAGHPTMHRHGENDAFRLRREEVVVKKLNAKWSAVRMPKIGWVKFRDTRELGEIRTATIIRDGAHWYISFACIFQDEDRQPSVAVVGIDRGVVNTLALSTGELLSIPVSVTAVTIQRGRAQRVLARRRKGSHRHEKQKTRVAALHARTRRIRLDWCHRTSADISRRFGTVVIEDLKVANMTRSARGSIAAPGRGVRQKAGLNRSILAQGWGIFERLLAYKLASNGGTLEKVPAMYTSQTCQACGHVDAKNRESQSVFRCVNCGHTDHADTNASLEILRRSTALKLAEGPGCRPGEARTIRDRPSVLKPGQSGDAETVWSEPPEGSQDVAAMRAALAIGGEK